jgi:hypothetical protein
MPRIYSPNEDHNFLPGTVDFFNGAAAMPYGGDTSYFASKEYSIDANKHELTIWDKLSLTQLVEICGYLSITVDADATKQEIVRAIETFADDKLMADLTVASVAGTASGDTKITVTPSTGPLVYIVDTADKTPLYLDDVSHWASLTSGGDITAATGSIITVAKKDANGKAIAAGHQTVTAKA